MVTEAITLEIQRGRETSTQTGIQAHRQRDKTEAERRHRSRETNTELERQTQRRKDKRRGRERDSNNFCSIKVCVATFPQAANHNRVVFLTLPEGPDENRLPASSWSNSEPWSLTATLMATNDIKPGAY